MTKQKCLIVLECRKDKQSRALWRHLYRTTVVSQITAVWFLFSKVSHVTEQLPGQGICRLSPRSSAFVSSVQILGAALLPFQRLTQAFSYGGLSCTMRMALGN